MSWGTVYQLELMEITDENIMTEGTANDTPFLDSVADYVDETRNRAQYEEYLVESLTRWNTEDRELVVITRNEKGHVHSIVFRDGFQKAFLRSSYVKFVDLLAQLSESTTPESFSNGRLDGQVTLLKLAYSDEYSDYICTNECEFLPINEFIRTIVPDVPYYLGGIMQYHY